MPRALTPLHLASYTRCPLRTYLLWDKIKGFREALPVEIIGRVARRAYLHELKHESKADWRLLPKWVDVEIRALVKDLSSFKEVKNILSRLQVWYDKQYMINPNPVVVNLPIRAELDSGLIYTDHIEIIHILDGHNLMIEDFKEASGEDNILRDIKALARVWGLMATMDKPLRITHYQRQLVSIGTITPIRIEITDKLLEKIDKIVKHILRGIERDIFYPAISVQCGKCPVRPHCSILTEVKDVKDYR